MFRIKILDLFAFAPEDDRIVGSWFLDAQFCEQIVLLLLPELDERTSEDVGETVQEFGYHRFYTNIDVGFFRETRHALIDYPARNYIVEPIQIDVAIQCQTVRGDETTSVHANRAHFIVADPNAGVRRGGCIQTEFPAQINDGLLDVTDIPPHALLELSQIDYGIGHKLTGSMESDQTTTIGLIEISPCSSQPFRLILCVIFPPDAHSVHRCVLEQQHAVESVIVGAGMVELRQSSLHLLSIPVAYPT